MTTTKPRRMAAQRPRRHSRAALALTIATGTLLVCVGSAGATTYRPHNGASFSDAVAKANLRGGHDTIVLREAIYSPNAIVNITDNLTITGEHNDQATGFTGPFISGDSVPGGDFTDTINVAVGVTARFEGVTVTGFSAQPFNAMTVRGTVVLEGASFSGNGGNAVNVLATGSAVITNTSIDNGPGDGVVVAGGTATLTNTNVANNGVNGIRVIQGGTAHLRNSILGFNGTADCVGPIATVVASIDVDGSCGSATTADPELAGLNFNGGPTLSQEPAPTSPAIDAGNPSDCPTTDQRFFVRPAGQCDIGAYELGAVQDTTDPDCRVTFTGDESGVRIQRVTVSDAEGGVGNDAIPANRPEVASPPVFPGAPFPAAVDPFLVNHPVGTPLPAPTESPAYTHITNGTVAFTPLANPVRSAPGVAGLVLTASKTTVGFSTKWAFTAQDWAGNRRDCR